MSGGKLVRALGSALRAMGKGIDDLGCALQGRLAYRDTLSRAQSVAPFGGKRPRLADEVFVAPSATVLGDVAIGRGSSVWYGAVVRGDVHSVTIGARTSIQDNAVVHVARHNAAGLAAPTVIGDDVTVAHGATVHAATVEDRCLIGMGATVMDGARVCAGAVVAAGALVPPGAVVPSGEVWGGAPARFLRALEPGEAEFVASAAGGLAELAAVHAAECGRSPAEVELDAARRADRRARDPEFEAQHGIERDAETREVVAVAQST